MGQTKRLMEEQREQEPVEVCINNGQIESMIEGIPASVRCAELEQEVAKLQAWNKKLWDVKQKLEMETAAKLRIFEKLQSARSKIGELENFIVSLKKILKEGDGYDELLSRQLNQDI